MDEFRVEATLADNPYRDAAGSNAKKRRKDRNVESEVSAADPQDVVTLSGQTGREAGSDADLYTPAPRTDESD